MTTLVFYAQFTASKVGKNSITVTWDVERITRSDGTRSALVTGGANSVTVGRRGLYGYVLTNADLITYDYLATAITSDATVDQKEIPALWTKYTETDSAIADAVWDEVLTGGTHNVNQSAGRRLRQLASTIIIDGTAQGAGINGNQIILANDASATDGAYDPSLVAIVAGTGAGQSRLILQYDGASRTATVDRDWKVNPDVTSEYIIYADPGREHVNEGLLQGATINTATLNTSASSINDDYVGQLLFIRSGLGDDQVRVISAYNGTTKVATLSTNWGAIPDNTSGYVILPNHIHELSEIASSVWNNATRTLTDFSTMASDVWSHPTRTLSSFGTLVQTIWTYITRTLTSSSDLSITDIWTYPNRTLTPPDNKYSSGAFVYKSKLEMVRGVTNELRVLLGDLTDHTEILFTVKNKKTDLDAASLIQIRKTTGLEVLNGAPYLGSITDGKITVVDVLTGEIIITLEVDPSAELPILQSRPFDTKVIYPTKVTRPAYGEVDIEIDITNAIV